MAKQSQQTYLTLRTKLLTVQDIIIGSLLNNHPMSSLQNNASNAFFTETNLSVNNQYNSMTIRKSYNKQQKPSGYSSILYKGKQSSFSKQRLISPELQNIISKIQTFVEDIDNKIQNRVQLVKQVYVNQYKEQVLQMSAQLKHLRQKLDNQVMKQRANQKMFYLEEERDFFRHEVIKLNEQMNKLNEENKNLKKMLEEEKRQSQNYKKIVYGLEEKILKLKNVNIQRNMLLTSSSKDPLEKTFKHSSTIDTQINHYSGSKTERVYNNKPTKSLQTIEDESQREMSRTGYRLNPSHSVKAYPKFSTPTKEPLRSTVNYPKITVQKLQKIEGYSELLERQRVVDECINELKREIYYRNLSIGDKDTKIHFGQTAQVKFESFTKTDKKQLIIKLLSNQRILNEFYQFLFNPNPLTNASASRNPEDDHAPTTQLINNKLDLSGGNGLGNNKWSLKKLNSMNPKFNTQILTGLKTQFSKKIFDIKHSNK